MLHARQQKAGYEFRPGGPHGSRAPLTLLLHFVPLSFSQNRSCDSFRPFVGGDDFRICCDCCALGIKAKTDYDVSCSVDLFPVNAGKTSSSQCIKAFKECCNGKKML